MSILVMALQRFSWQICIVIHSGHNLILVKQSKLGLVMSKALIAIFAEEKE
jgi:hypothetical protein